MVLLGDHSFQASIIYRINCDGPERVPETYQGRFAMNTYCTDF